MAAANKAATAVIDALWAQIEPIVFITRDQFERALADWQIEPVEIDGQLAFVALTRGPEFHFSSFETGAVITRSMIRSRLNAIIERCGFVMTRTPRHGFDRQHRLNKALGFVEIGSDEFFTTYRLETKCR